MRNLQVMRSRASIRTLILMAYVALLAACSSVTVQKNAELDRSAGWLQMPIVNNSNTPLAGQKAESIVSAMLQSKQVQVKQYPALAQTKGFPLLNDNARYEQAKSWAQEQSTAAYWVTGTVDEWRYKAGLSGEAAVSLTLKVLDANTGDVVWVGTGAKTGSASIGIVAKKLIKEMVDKALSGK